VRNFGAGNKKDWTREGEGGGFEVRRRVDREMEGPTAVKGKGVDRKNLESSIAKRRQGLRVKMMGSTEKEKKKVPGGGPITWWGRAAKDQREGGRKLSQREEKMCGKIRGGGIWRG